MTHKLIPACYALIIKENKILMVQRHNTSFMNGYWSLPAGHVEHKEDIKTAVIREAKEEVDIDLLPEDINPKIILHTYNDPEDYEQIHFFYQADQWTGKPINNEPDKCSQVSWIELDRLKDYKVIPYIKYVLENLDSTLQFLELEN
jgi:ADP-ribose pyrophosphatase YjhB (NUDIX family)